jgi:hypothetical protein
MSKLYFLNIDSNNLEETAKQLNSLGYRNNELNKDEPCTHLDDDGDPYLGVIKTWHEGKGGVAVEIDVFPSFVDGKVMKNDLNKYLEVYTYKGEYNNHKEIKKLHNEDCLPYLKELIDLEIVEECEV